MSKDVRFQLDQNNQQIADWTFWMFKIGLSDQPLQKKLQPFPQNEDVDLSELAAFLKSNSGPNSTAVESFSSFINETIKDCNKKLTDLSAKIVDINDLKKIKIFVHVSHLGSLPMKRLKEASY